MVPDKFNMVDMEGIDILFRYGDIIPGLYQKLVESIAQCRYQCLYNWYFDGVLIPPTYVEMTVVDNEVWIGEGVSVDEEDTLDLIAPELKTVTGVIASITDALAKPARELVAALNPQQDLHGYDHPWPAGGGKNKLNVIGTDTDNGYVASYYLKSDGTLGGNDTYVGFITEYIPLSAETQYMLSSASGSAPGICFYDSSKQYISGIAYSKSSGTVNIAITTPANTAYCRASVPNAYKDAMMLELGSTATSYAPYENICPISGWTGVNIYNEETYDVSAIPKLTIIWQNEVGTVYGGTLDLVTGEFIVTDANIASYNGEVLPSTWISSMDVYAEGVIPTAGAQVVYKLAEPLIYYLTPSQLPNLLKGDSDIWHNDNGDISVTYWYNKI